MSRFLLVHGAWHGGWCYRRVEQLLQQRGHFVLTPTLTGLGERSHQFREDLRLEDHVADVLGVIRHEELDDFVLVGHSYGGCVISVVADRVPEKIRALVYLDAFVPRDGECLMDHLSPKIRDVYRSQAAAYGGGVSPLPAKVVRVNDRDAAMVDRLCVNQPVGTFEERVRYTAGETADYRQVHVLATKFESAAFRPFDAERASDPAWTIYALDCGHDLMLDEPALVADILEDASR